MNLFEDTDLFNSGSSGKRVFELPDAELVLWENFFSKAESDNYYEILLRNTAWREHQLSVYDKTHVIPRMIAWYENADNYCADPNRPPWPPELLQIKSRVEAVCGVTFNSVLLNLYRDGRDGVAWHSDREANFGKDAIIGSVSFGQTRPFRIRHKTRKDILPMEILLHHGSFLFMAGKMQSCWEHMIPKTAKDILPRINLTFRQVKRP